MTREALELVPIYLGPHDPAVDRLAATLSVRLEVAVGVRPPRFDPETSFDPSRGQYNSTVLLRQLVDSAPEGVWRVLGVTSADLFIPILTYVFGEAQLEGRAAVVSIHRLSPEAYGLERDDALLEDRLVKESVHELGHTFGLIHCVDPRCVMHASTYVEEIDLKSSTFCAACAQGVDEARR